MAQRVFVGASAAATLPAALSAAVLVSAPFAGTAVSPLADARPVSSGVVTAEQQQPRPGGPGAADWMLIAAGEAVILGAAAATGLLRRRARSLAG